MSANHAKPKLTLKKLRATPARPPKNKRQRRHELNLAIIGSLAERFPKCFAICESRRKPLKVGIRDDIFAAIGDVFNKSDVFAALGYYASNPAYRKKLRAGATRFDLNGNPAGVVTAEQAAGTAIPHPALKALRRNLEQTTESALAERLAVAISELEESSS
jgi:sRNA-binding protein